jgi:hypothetical protein
LKGLKLLTNPNHTIGKNDSSIVTYKDKAVSFKLNPDLNSVSN